MPGLSCPVKPKAKATMRPVTKATQERRELRRLETHEEQLKDLWGDRCVVPGDDRGSHVAARLTEDNSPHLVDEENRPRAA